MFLGLSIFFYSNCLPDLPFIYRRKPYEVRKDLSWYKKYFLLLLAPLLIWAFLSGLHLEWATTENFHNFKSLTIYGVFLIFIGLFLYGDVMRILSLPFYGVIGYLTHLKVDRIW